MFGRFVPCAFEQGNVVPLRGILLSVVDGLVIDKSVPRAASDCISETRRIESAVLGIQSAVVMAVAGHDVEKDARPK